MATKTPEDLKFGQVYLRRGRWYAVVKVDRHDGTTPRTVTLYSGRTGCDMDTFISAFHECGPVLKKSYETVREARDSVDHATGNEERITARVEFQAKQAKRFNKLKAKTSEEDKCRTKERQKAQRKLRRRNLGSLTRRKRKSTR